jgi:hypothetical protein
MQKTAKVPTAIALLVLSVAMFLATVSQAMACESVSGQTVLGARKGIPGGRKGGSGRF